jgi:hypothetical protein
LGNVVSRHGWYVSRASLYDSTTSEGC